MLWVLRCLSQADAVCASAFYYTTANGVDPHAFGGDLQSTLLDIASSDPSSSRTTHPVSSTTSARQNVGDDIELVA
jgi:hypothetical protein